MHMLTDALEQFLQTCSYRLNFSFDSIPVRPTRHETATSGRAVRSEDDQRKVMLSGDPLQADLARGQFLKLVGAEGSRIVCLAGRLWVTEEGEREEFLLSSGCSLTLRHRGVAILSALRPSRVAIHAVNPARNAATPNAALGRVKPPSFQPEHHANGAFQTVFAKWPCCKNPYRAQCIWRCASTTKFCRS